MGGRQRSGRPTQHGGRDPIPDEGLALAREAYERGEWSEAHVRLTTLDQRGSLTADDLRRLSILAYLLGRDDECIDLLVRAYHEHLNNGVDAEAARCACWLGYLLTDQGKAAGGAAWFARGQALIDDGDLDCSALGFLQAATGFAAFAAGEYSAAVVAFDEASTIAARFGDRDLTTLVGLGFGHSLVKKGERARGVAVLDEVMVAVTAGEVSPIMNGLAYCAVIDVCQEIFDLRRAREWTAELARWCDAHPDLTPFRGQCLVHRAEIMQHHGAWVDALEEAEAARQRLSTPVEQPALGLADYRRGELHRLRGEFTEAEDAYNHARRWGHSAQPGLALLWLAMGRTQDGGGGRPPGPGPSRGCRRSGTGPRCPRRDRARRGRCDRGAEIGRRARRDRRRIRFAPARRGGEQGPRVGAPRRGRRGGCRHRAPAHVGGVAGARGAVRGAPGPGS